MKGMLQRRELLAALLGTTVLGPSAFGFGSSSKVDVVELDLGPGTASRPNAWRRLLFDVEATTSVEIEPRSVLMAPDDPALFEHPFAVVVGTGAFAMPSSKALEQLSRYLSYGGFLLLDDSSALSASGFYASVKNLTRTLFPTRSLTPIGSEHSIYRSFFLLQHAVGRLDRHPFLEGVTVGNLSPVIVFRNDLSGALERNESGLHPYPCVPGGERQRREAVKMGVNLMMYALTANYKRDQVHVRELILKGRWTE